MYKTINKIYNKSPIYLNFFQSTWFNEDSRTFYILVHWQIITQNITKIKYGMTLQYEEIQQDQPFCNKYYYIFFHNIHVTNFLLRFK